ncbi:MAG: hypothetical protein OXE40_00405 [Gammaproteobacteria bacterium]|nr:hypothetical protein [Gammaproteobacteria bacterium]
MNTHLATARNYAEQSENRMHSDGTARTFGFAAALVPGVVVFGHMTRPLVESLGAAFLEGREAEIRLIKPAYDGDTLAVEHTEEEGGHLVRCMARGALIAEMRCRAARPPLDPMAGLPGGEPVDGKPEIAFDLVRVGEPFPAFVWKPDRSEHELYASQVDDDLPIWRGDLLHPHALLSTANRALSNRFRLPAWLHVGSKMVFREPVRHGEEIEVRAVPVEKWRRKGHEFIDLYVAYLVAGRVKMEIRHTAIFRIAART